jgi:hypothetical protein
VIYFARTPTGSIKIGYSLDVDARFKTLSCHLGSPTTLLCTMEGDRDSEKNMHRKFYHLRIGRTEQFRPGSDLLDFIGAMPSSLTSLDFRDVRFLSVKIDAQVARKAKLVATYRGVTLAEYISSVVGDVVSQHLKEETAKMADEPAAKKTKGAQK